MHLSDKFKGRENDPVTPDVMIEVARELNRAFWWAKIRGKCYAPAELRQMTDKFPGLKIGEIKQVDPRLELSRANEILVKLHERRMDFELRIKKYNQPGP